MKFVLFYHSLVSDWNHGNAHFLRGVVSELMTRGHAVEVYEPENGWSYQHLKQDCGEKAIAEFRARYPNLSSTFYDPKSLDIDVALDGADAVLVHEWNSSEIIQRLGEHHRKRKDYRLFFHDTHHRSVTDPEFLLGQSLRDYDGALVFGESLRELYRTKGWTKTVFVWHEAADTRMFKPIPCPNKAGDLVWIGNWGDDERKQEIDEFLLEPVRKLRLRSEVFGVRYPREALEALGDSGITYRGWLPNFRAPETFGRFLLTVHIPRGPYSKILSGIPTIRVFEALACGIPLICAPWDDSERLFTSGKDYLVAKNGTEMTDMIKTLIDDTHLRRQLSEHGLHTIAERHTCRHRVNELLEIVRQ